jgi:hypothetical protein
MVALHGGCIRSVGENPADRRKHALVGNVHGNKVTRQ